MERNACSGSRSQGRRMRWLRVVAVHIRVMRFWTGGSSIGRAVSIRSAMTPITDRRSAWQGRIVQSRLQHPSMGQETR
jgi:hypothetical protein